MKRIDLRYPIIFLITAVIFVTAAAVLLPFAHAESKITGISITLKDSTLDSSDTVVARVYRDGKEQLAEYYDVYDHGNMTLTVKYSDGTSKKLSGEQIARFESQSGALLNISDGQNDSPWGLGAHTVTYTMAGCSTKATYTVEKNKIASISVKPYSPVKPLYHFSGEYRAFSDNGSVDKYFRYALEDFDYKITLKYTNGTSLSCPLSELYEKTGYTAEFSHDKTELSVGKHTGYCTVNGVTCGFTFEIVKNTVASISLHFDGEIPTLKYPDDGRFVTDSNGKKYFRYYYDRSALRATVTYTDGSKKDMPLGELSYLLHGELILDDGQEQEPWLPGNKTVKGCFNGVETSVGVIVAPANVTGVKASAVSFDSAKVSWDPVPAEGYSVELYTDGAWKTLYTAKYGEIETIISGLPAGSSCKAGVRAFNTINGVKSYTTRQAVTFTTPADPSQPPADVSGFKVKETTLSSLTLSWNVSTDADGYILEINKSGKWAGYEIPAKTSSYKISGLSPNVKYSVRIKAYRNEGGNTLYSGLSEVEGVTAMSRVTGFSVASKSASSLKLQWTKNPDANSYVIEILSGGKWIGYEAAGSAVTYTVNGLSAGTAYDLRIRPVAKADGKTVYGEYTTLSAVTALKDMSGFKLHTRGIGALKFSWDKNTSSTGYQLQIYKGGKWVTYNIKSGGTTAYVISGLSAGTKYNVRIRPMKTISGTTVYGSYKTITAITSPSNMSGFKLHTRGIGALKFSWSRNTSATGYQLQIYKGGKWVTYNIKSGGTTAYVISGLSAGTKYNVRIRPMKTISGTTVYGSYKTITAITSPSNMSGFKLHTRGIGALKFSWSRNTSATGYQLQIYKSGKWVTYNIKSGATTAYTISGLSAGTKYNVRIRPMKTISGTTVYGSYKTITAITAPSNMSGFKLAAQGRNSLKIGWSKNASATGYQLQIYKGGKWVTYTISGNTKTSYTVKSLSAGTKYKFRIRAYKKIGTSTVYGNFSATKTFSTKR